MKIIKFLFSPAFMGSLFVLFAVTMAAATFIENDFGPAVSYARVYNAKWFELIFLLLAANLIGQLIIYKMFRKEKLPVALFHLAFILMIAGAGITRYFGSEGSIHIREGESANKFSSSEKYLGYELRDRDGNLINEDFRRYTITTTTADNYKKKIKAGDADYKLVLARIIPNAMETISDDPQGEPVVSLMITRSMISREVVILKRGDIKIVEETSIGFEPAEDCDLTVMLDSGSFTISSNYKLEELSMMSGEAATVNPGEKIALESMHIVSYKDIRIVPQRLSAAGKVKPVYINPEEQKTGQNAFIFHIFSGSRSESVTLWVRDSETITEAVAKMDDLEFTVKYGSRITELPFELKLDDFLLERYPGSNSPSGYKSFVTLVDNKEGVIKPFEIFMNNILKYKGYRFYQSSYDPDEKGTVLSVSHDFEGMIVTYSGYALLFLFIILSLINKNSLLNTIKAGAWNSSLRKGAALVIFLIAIQGFMPAIAQDFIPSKKSSEEVGKVLVQDQKGRTKPLFTLSNDILRKVARENKFGEYTPMQVFLGLYIDFDSWKEVPLIRVSNKDIQQQLGITGNTAAFSDIVNIDGDGTYKLSEEVNAAYAKSPGERNKFDKEVMKVDERVNIVYMIYKGGFMKMFPLKDGSHSWGSPEEALKNAQGREDSVYLQSIIPLLTEALENNNTADARQISESVTGYQDRFTEYSLPSSSKTSAEMLYYKMGIFEKLFPFYSSIGLVMLIGLIIMVIRGRKKTSIMVKILGWHLFAGFIFHTFGLALRWYISGHSPMSNGYESMIFISWVTLLAGFIFSRKSVFALSATAVLAGMTLMVAHLSFMDPEITNLVPVLKSYWLTLHVSVITGSYGFLGLGAILGIITMILISLSNDSNRERISNTIDELTVINFRTLTLGVYFLTIGTFLGAVWANESWGRYWGWDPKETWSLITIIIYTLVTHSKMIPGMKSIYTFNLLSLFAFSSVLMTYFGVNYYLSGLHSYASGDPVPVPAFVYIAVIVLVGLALIAYMKYRKLKMQ
jgi:cytochrome c-type biogenesis protein CcsB